MTKAERDFIKRIESIVFDIYNSDYNARTRKLFFLEDILFELRTSADLRGAEDAIKKYCSEFQVTVL